MRKEKRISFNSLTVCAVPIQLEILLLRDVLAYGAKGGDGDSSTSLVQLHHSPLVRFGDTSRTKTHIFVIAS